jgi:hypothetical protein
LAPAGQSIASKTTPGETKARALAFAAPCAVGAFEGLRGIRNASAKATDCSKPLLVATAKIRRADQQLSKGAVFLFGFVAANCCD